MTVDRLNSRILVDTVCQIVGVDAEKVHEWVEKRADLTVEELFRDMDRYPIDYKIERVVSYCMGFMGGITAVQLGVVREAKPQ